MKTKLIKSVAAVLALTAAGAANAGIDSPIFGGDGELFLTIWDPTVGNEASFNIGLNINVSTFNGSSTYTFSNIFSDPVFQQYFGASSLGGSNLANQSVWQWNVVGADSLADEAIVLFTQNGSGFVGINNAATDNAAQGAVNYQTALGASCDSCGTDVKANLKYAGDNWGNNFAGAAPVNNATGIGTALNFYRAVDNQYPDYITTGLDPATMTEFAGTWLLSADGTLTYSAASTPVPVPAAVWLLGSGLLGLFGVGRRRAAQVA